MWRDEKFIVQYQLRRWLVCKVSLKIKRETLSLSLSLSKYTFFAPNHFKCWFVCDKSIFIPRYPVLWCSKCFMWHINVACRTALYLPTFLFTYVRAALLTGNRCKTIHSTVQRTKTVLFADVFYAKLILRNLSITDIKTFRHRIRVV